MSVDCIRIGAVRLSLALMLALIVVPGYVVAPILFAKAGSAALAGMLAGEIFHLANLGLIFLTAAVAVFWLRMRGTDLHAGRWRWLLLLAVVVPVLINEFALAPIMADLKLQMGSVDLVAEDNPIRKEFGMWHGVSALLHMLAAIAAALLVALGAASRTESEA